MLPEGEPAVIVAKVLYLVMICFSYPVIIYACNIIVESIIFKYMEYSELRKWLKNLSRTIILIAALSLVISIYYKLHIFLGFVAIALGGTVVIFFPALIHNKLVAKTTLDRSYNYFMMIYAVLVAVIITVAQVYIGIIREKRKEEQIANGQTP